MDRRGFMAAAGGGFAASGFGIPVSAGTREATFLVAHGAWSAGWGGDGWRVAPNPSPPDTPAEDVKWIQGLRLPQPVKTFETPLRLRNGDTKIPRTYIYCKRINPEDTFRIFAERARREHWTCHEIDSSHSPHITAPDALLALLLAQA